MRGKGFLAVGLVTTALAVTVGSAQGAVTIGSNLAADPDPAGNFGCNGQDCTITNVVTVPGSVAPGGATSPVNGTVTSWSFKSGSASANPIRLRVLHALSNPVFPVATGAGTSAEVPDAIGVIGPNPTSLPIKTGDSIGLDLNSSLVEANTAGVRLASWNPPLADSNTTDATSTFANVDVLVQATVEPTNTVTAGAITRNKKKGTATVTITVPNPGQLSYVGTGVNVTGPASIAAPGDVQLTVRATGKKRKKLNKKGKVSVSFGTTFTPNFGAAAITPTNLILRKKLKKK
jgi:hypothetical protein